MYDTHKDKGELSDETVLNNILKETSLTLLMLDTIATQLLSVLWLTWDKTITCRSLTNILLFKVPESPAIKTTW